MNLGLHIGEAAPLLGGGRQRSFALPGEGETDGEGWLNYWISIDLSPRFDVTSSSRARSSLRVRDGDVFRRRSSRPGARLAVRRRKGQVPSRGRRRRSRMAWRSKFLSTSPPRGGQAGPT